MGLPYPLPTYCDAVYEMRVTHRPAVFHIQQVTQQLGHSTSGDHRRYKDPERLKFEEEFDCNRRLAEWMVHNGIATAEEIENIKKEAKREATEAAQRAFRGYHDKVAELKNNLLTALQDARASHPNVPALGEILNELGQMREPLRFELLQMARRALLSIPEQHSGLQQFAALEHIEGNSIYSDNLLSQSAKSPIEVREEKASTPTNRHLRTATKS